ncbi:MAG: alanine racemase [Rhodothalassiaceae bacterium]
MSEVKTPALLLDRARLARNLAMMRNRAAALGVTLRPHVKTAKSWPVIERALAGGPAAITVSTLREAAFFLDRGITDITYAVGIAPSKLEAAAALIAEGAALTLLLDSHAQLAMLKEAAARLGVVFPALIEIDVDSHRAGLVPESDELVAIGRALAEDPGTQLRGVLTHAGGAYDCDGPAAIRAMAERERAGTVAAAERLRAAGLACPVVSVGSTPTATFAARLDGVSELRAGVYMFQDLVQAGLGVCRIDDIALSVLATVIGHQAARGRLIVDAGWTALSQDRGTARQAVDQGYGLVCDRAGRPTADLVVRAVNQEHGIIARRDGGPLDLDAWPVGSLLRILPNHACATAACHAAYHVLDEAGRVADRWERFSGW